MPGLQQALWLRRARLDWSGDLSSLENAEQLYQLQLTGTQVLGDISAVQRAAQLSRLNLASTRIGGDLASLAQLSQLKAVLLSGSDVRGDVSSLAGLLQLQELDLERLQQVQGSLRSLANLTALQVLQLTGTNVSGPVGALRSHLQLGYLDLSHTLVAGSLEDLGELQLLQELRLSGTGVGGDIKTAAKLSKLEVLELDGTQVYGDVGVLGGLTDLQQTTLANSHVDGAIREADAPLYATLEFLDISGTQVSGAIDQGKASAMKQLKQLSIAYSAVGVELPICDTTTFQSEAEYAVFPALISLDVSGCKLGLQIQDFLGSLSFSPYLTKVVATGADLGGYLPDLLALPLATVGGTLMADVQSPLSQLLSFLDLGGTNITAAGTTWPALTFLGLANTQLLQSVDLALLLPTTSDSVTVDLRGSAFDGNDLFPSLLRPGSAVVYTDQVGYLECFELVDHTGQPLPHLLVSQDRLAPAELCQCMAGSQWNATASPTHCSRCSDGMYNPMAGGSCLRCAPSFLFSVGASGSTCVLTLLGSLLTLPRLVAILGTACTVCVFSWAAGSSPIQDISVDGTTALVTCFRSHGLLPWCPGVLVQVRGTGNTDVDRQFFRVALVQRPFRLFLEGFPEHFKASQGSIRVAFPQCLLVRGILVPAAVLLTALVALVSLLLIRLDRAMGEEDSNRAPARLLALTCGVGLAMPRVLWRLCRHVPTPMRCRILEYQRKLAEANPQPAPCERGPDRAVSAGQVCDLFAYFEDIIGSGNMHYMDASIIRPLTQRHRLSYAELAGPHRTTWFVSHFWGSPFRHFVEALKRHALAMSVSVNWRDDAYWICSFSINQWKVGEEVRDWAESSFFRALRSGVRGTVMVLDEQALPLTRVWCLFEVLQTFELQGAQAQFLGLILSTATGVLDQGAASVDLTLTVARRVSLMKLQDAESTKKSDKQQIFDLVESRPGGFPAVNQQLRARFREAMPMQKVYGVYEREFADLAQRLESTADLEEEDSGSVSAELSPPVTEVAELLTEGNAAALPGSQSLPGLLGHASMQERKQPPEAGPV